MGFIDLMKENGAQFSLIVHLSHTVQLGLPKRLYLEHFIRPFRLFALGFSNHINRETLKPWFPLGYQPLCAGLRFGCLWLLINHGGCYQQGKIHLDPSIQLFLNAFISTRLDSFTVRKFFSVWIHVFLFQGSGFKGQINQYVCCKFEMLLHNTNTVSFVGI